MSRPDVGTKIRILDREEYPTLSDDAEVIVDTDGYEGYFGKPEFTIRDEAGGVWYVEEADEGSAWEVKTEEENA